MILSDDERDDMVWDVFRLWRPWGVQLIYEGRDRERARDLVGQFDGLYAELTSGFDEAEVHAQSREDLSERIEALARRLEREFAELLDDHRARQQYDAIVARMLHAVRGLAR